MFNDKKGQIYYGTPSGFCIFHPNLVNYDSTHTPTIISDFKIFHKSFDELPNKKKKQLSGKTHPLYSKNITLTSSDNNIGIKFAALSYVHPEKKKYAYKLEGFDKDWIYTDATSRTAFYTNLPSGEYRFLVKTLNEGRVENENYEEFGIKVLPPFYKTIWAYLIYVVITISLLYYIVRTYHGRIKLQESLKYEKQHIRDVEELNQSKLRFFTNISHEFRTPLTVIVGQIEMLLQVQSFPPAIYNKLLNVYKNGLQLRGLISELLDFRKQEQGHMKIKVSRHNLVDFLYENYLLYIEYASTRHIKFYFNKDQDQLEVWYDSRQMQKVINNLLSNAFKYTPEKGSISINISKRGEEAIIEVQDSGKGIKPEEAGKIFERFYQTSNDPENTQGTGIGLALSKGIVELHKGRIEVSSNQTSGTTFTIALKLGNAHFTAEQIETEEPKEEEAAVIVESKFMVEQQVLDDTVKERIKGAKVLIVEDNDSLREMLAGLFEPYYEIITAADGEEGLKEARDRMPDLIISDVVMPKMTGIELCKQIKQDFETCHIPVVLLTARTAIEHTIEGLRIGADDYITKPFNVNLLISRCNNLVNSRIVLQEKFSKQPQTRVQMLATNPMDKDLLDRTVAIIEKNMDNAEFSLNDVIRELCISRTNFFSKMKAITGQTPNDFILTIRLKKAAYLLKNELFLSIAEVADQTGFSSPRYFSRCFKEVYGISPLFYRTGNKDEDVEETEEETGG